MSTSIINTLKFLTSTPNKFFFNVTLGTVCLHGLYTYSTSEQKIISIKNKYKFNRNGYTEFMIIDINNKHYNVKNSFWYWKWDSIEDWNSLEINKQYHIRYYGYRIPFLGIFPNCFYNSTYTNSFYYENNTDKNNIPNYI